MSKTLRFAIVSDLHYRMDRARDRYRPATGEGGDAYDPLVGLLKYLEQHRAELSDRNGRIADYLLCPGDICDKADGGAFDEGWKQLKELQNVLRAPNLIASTGNHEVRSRVSDADQTKAGNAVVAIDPLENVQRNADYPSALLNGQQRWIYWGRGYEIILQDDLLVLLVNSSHFHPTMQDNEYERGRIGQVALDELKKELGPLVKTNKSRVFLLLLHHHPISHQHLDVDLGRIDMYNGELLMQVLSDTGVAWFVVHGHKHFPRLVIASDAGDGCSVVFAAGSLGAVLSGESAARTHHQFYLAELEILAQDPERAACGRFRAFSWLGRDWVSSSRRDHGLPDHCGFRIPAEPISALTAKIEAALAGVPTFKQWSELAQQVPGILTILPDALKSLRRSLESASIKTTWPADNYFPTDISR